MAERNDIETVKSIISKQIQEIRELIERIAHDHDAQSGYEHLKLWKRRTSQQLSKYIHPEDSERFDRLRLGTYGRWEAVDNLIKGAQICEGFLKARYEELERHPDNVLSSSAPANISQEITATQIPNSNAVFIIHGHDELNLRRLEQTLRERWQLEPIVLARQAGKGRTLIEKFEEEAQRACYAFALLTPDDIVTCQDAEYTQARPNVIFELGWFYARLGRDRVSILCKKGMAIHSDLSGISRIEFVDSLEDKVSEIERELTAIGIIER